MSIESEKSTVVEGVKRVIRSYVLRQGRLTEGQQRVLNERWCDYGLDLSMGSLDYAQLFGREAPVVLEIGYGNGASLAAMAQANTESDYIGVEVHRPGVGHLLINLEDNEISNVRTFCEDVNLVLAQCIPDRSLSRVQIYFPDPWPKKKHRKRRLVQPPFIQALIKKLKPGGVIHLATDWEDYAKQMLAVMQGEPQLENLADSGRYHVRPDYRPLTRFEQKGMRKGHGVWDLLFSVNV